MACEEKRQKVQLTSACPLSPPVAFAFTGTSIRGEGWGEGLESEYKP
jgi:hypothetical protein